jgi:hypothetical protein
MESCLQILITLETCASNTDKLQGKKMMPSHYENVDDSVAAIPSGKRG